MKTLLVVTSQVLLLLFGSKAFADTIDEHLMIGWTPVYQGYEVVKKCNGKEEPMRMGKYLVECDDYGYYYHYDEVTLLKRLWDTEDKTVISYKLCLTDDFKEDTDCLSVDVLNMPWFIPAQ